MNTHIPSVRAFLGLAVCVIYPSLAMFRKLNHWILGGYIIVSLVALWIATTWLTPRARSLLSPRSAALLLAVLMASLFCAQAYIHPQIDTDGFQLAGKSYGSSDSDDAIDLAISEFSEGRYPYYKKTFLDGPITPMPGALLIASPFYWMGETTVQHVAWIGLFFLGIAFFYRDVHIALATACIMCFLSPATLYQLFQGGDYITNSVYILVTSGLLVLSVQKKSRLSISILLATLFGIALSSRFNFFLMTPLIFFALWRASSLKTSMLLCGISAAAFGAVTLPFLLHDIAGFSPLHTSSKLSHHGQLPWTPVVVPLLGLGLSFYLGFKRKENDISTLCLDIFIVQAAVIFGAHILTAMLLGNSALGETHFGLLFTAFGYFYFAPICLGLSKRERVSPTNDGREPLLSSENQS